ncbi:MAG: hypothetical protein ACU84J_04705, partial [Gammaproteobacteria bacterium]
MWNKRLFVIMLMLVTVFVLPGCPFLLEKHITKVEAYAEFVEVIQGGSTTIHANWFDVNNPRPSDNISPRGYFAYKSGPENIQPIEGPTEVLTSVNDGGFTFESGTMLGETGPFTVEGEYCYEFRLFSDYGDHSTEFCLMVAGVSNGLTIIGPTDVVLGETVNLSVSIDSSLPGAPVNAPITYTWNRNGVALGGNETSLSDAEQPGRGHYTYKVTVTDSS